MPNTESASVRAGDWMYLFFNRDDSEHIDFWKVSEDSREPKAYRVNVKSTGGAIAVVYVPNGDRIQLYFIGPPAPGKAAPLLKEVALSNASKAGDPEGWNQVDMVLNKKEWKVDHSSMITAALDTKGCPRVFYNGHEELEHVNFAEYKELGNGKRDWTTTRFTGV